MMGETHVITKDRLAHDTILVDGEFKGMHAIVVRRRKGIRMCISQTLTIRNTKSEFGICLFRAL